MDARITAHAAFAARDWQGAYDGFRSCDTLTATDYDALGECAHWLGRAAEVIDYYTEAFRLHCEANAHGAAALSAFMLAIYYRVGGEPRHACDGSGECRHGEDGGRGGNGAVDGI